MATLMKTSPQLRAENATLFDEAASILAKTGGLLTEETTNEDRARITEIKSAILGNEAVIERLAADEADSSWLTKGRDEARRPVEEHRHADPRGGFVRSIGHGVITSDAWKAAGAAGEFRKSYPQLHVAVPDDVSIVAQAKLAGKALV